MELLILPRKKNTSQNEKKIISSSGFLSSTSIFAQEAERMWAGLRVWRRRWRYTLLMFSQIWIRSNAQIKREMKIDQLSTSVCLL